MNDQGAGTGFAPPSLWVVGVMLCLLVASSSVPSVLYPRYQADWHFSDSTLTEIFGVYALSVIFVLSLFGSKSDRDGRRGPITLSMLLGAGAIAIFAASQAVWMLFVARLVQGLATGLGLSALGGLIMDSASNSRAAALVNQIAPGLGMSLGALSAGLSVEYGPNPEVLIYLILLLGFCGCYIAARSLRETVTTGLRAPTEPLRWTTLLNGRPPQFWLLAQGTISAWAVNGFYLSLAPGITIKLLGSASYVAVGLCIMVFGVAATVAQVIAYSWGFVKSMSIGASELVVGTALVGIALWWNSAPLFFTGSIFLGFGSGMMALGSFYSLSASAKADAYAETVTVISIVSYLAFSAPSVLAGVALIHIGLEATTLAFGAVVIATAAVAVAAARCLKASEGFL